MKLLILQDEHFTCRSCTLCCRSWLVELMPGEPERIESLDWPEDDPLRGSKALLPHHGKTYLSRRADGACLFLNEFNGLCRIHEQFGVDAKPLGCRIFPFQIAPTFSGEASVIGRFDCPTVRKNEGQSHAAQAPELRRHTAQLGDDPGFNEATRCGLDRDQIVAVCEFVGTLMNGFARDDQRALFIVYLCDILSRTSAEHLNRATLGEVFLPLKKLVEGATSAPVKRPNWFQRLAFRTLLGLYLRRDEDVLTGQANRISRMFALMAIILGGGNFHSLGLSNRPGKLRRAKLFKGTLHPHDPTLFAPFWRMIRNRLDSFQFMGQANNGRDFLNGLRSLAMLYPLTLAVAKYNAANRGASQIEGNDVDQAITTIEHSFGRLPILNTPMTHSLEKLLMEQNVFGRVIQSV